MAILFAKEKRERELFLCGPSPELPPTILKSKGYNHKNP